MNNPLSDDPGYALWPDPPGCTGHRLWQLTSARTGATPLDYTGTFGRMNLVVNQMWSMPAARQRWEEIGPELHKQHDILLLLGDSVRRAVGGTMLPQIGRRGGVATLPHPSGLNRWYNDALNRAVAEILMEELYVMAGGRVRC